VVFIMKPEKSLRCRIPADPWVYLTL
jgi:hypothetical protein